MISRLTSSHPRSGERSYRRQTVAAPSLPPRSGERSYRRQTVVAPALPPRSVERSYGLFVVVLLVAGWFAFLSPPVQAQDDGVEGDVVTVVEKEAGFTRYDALLASLTIFVLAVFVGFEVITKVPPTLHTPLMSGSNAISGITIVGALLATGFGANSFVAIIGMIALVLATINVVGGFLVTHRMLEMFKKK